MYNILALSLKLFPSKLSSPYFKVLNSHYSFIYYIESKQIYLLNMYLINIVILFINKIK
nr:MAG TPA_asm: hypothetical protein [Caudoviricetes sp.]